MYEDKTSRLSIVCEEIPNSADIARTIGVKYYFTGVPCRNGHISKRYAPNNTCIECSRGRKKVTEANRLKAHEAKVRWYAKNADRERQRARSARANNPEAHREYDRRKLEKNPEAKRDRDRAYYQKNKVAIREFFKRKYYDNYDKYLEDRRRKYNNNPLPAKVQKAKRRAQAAQAGGSFTQDDVSRIRESQKDRCACCGTKLRKRGSLDHIVAIARAGTNWPRNLQLLCKSCNSSKHARDPIEFMQSRGLLL